MMTLISIEKASSRTKPPKTDVAACLARDTANCELVAERHASALREQFIAVLGHDLRNPLSAIISGMDIITRGPLDERQHVVAKLVKSSAARMSALIDDVMDFARGRLGDGMSLNRIPVQIALPLTQVINELRSSQSSRDIVSALDLPLVIDCDPGRLSQLLSNLLANALIHGSPDGPVIVRASAKDDIFELSVSNSGDPIPAAAIARLFEPFTRDEIRPSQQGLGLGLYIASEIARAHGGHIGCHRDTIYVPYAPQDIRRRKDNIMTEPTYWDNALYIIRGDLIELRRHVNALLADVGFCAEQSAVHAIEHIEDEAVSLSTNLRRRALRATRRGFRLHPRAAIAVSCVAGAVAGMVLYRALHKAPPRSQLL